MTFPRRHLSAHALSVWLKFSELMQLDPEFNLTLTGFEMGVASTTERAMWDQTTFGKNRDRRTTSRPRSRPAPASRTLPDGGCRRAISKDL